MINIIKVNYYCGNILCIFPILLKKDSKSQNLLLKNKIDKDYKEIINYIYNNPYNKYLSIKDIIVIVLVSILIMVEDFVIYSGYSKFK